MEANGLAPSPAIGCGRPCVDANLRAPGSSRPDIIVFAGALPLIGVTGPSV